MKKLKDFKLLSNDAQKAVFGGSTSTARCCDPGTDCCFPVFGAPVYPSTIENCGLIEDYSCDWWFSTKGCCF